MKRQIVFTAEFDAAVERLGGYRAVDVALESVIDGLVHNPYGFHRFENDHVSFRYAVTKATGELPALVVVFRIAEGSNVILEHVEEIEP